jgi:ornithine cyclodeaminase
MASHSVRVISRAQVKRCLSMKDAIALQRHAFLSLDSTTTVIPTRLLLSTPEGITLFKPAFVNEDSLPPVLGCKIVSVRPQNAVAGLPTVPGNLVLLDAETGLTKCLMDAEYLTGVRTAAGSGLFTDIMSSPEAEYLLIFGAGLQGAEHFKAMLCVRPKLKTVSFVNRTLKRAEDLVARFRGMQEYSHLHYNVLALDDNVNVCTALAAADIICTTTNASTALFNDDDHKLKPGCHINAIGSFTTDMVELGNSVIDRATGKDASKPGDSLAVIDCSEARAVGEFTHLSTQEKETHLLVASDALQEDAKVMREKRRRNPGGVSLFKSVGVATQDMVTAGEVLRAAEEQNIGTVCEL